MLRDIDLCRELPDGSVLFLLTDEVEPFVYPFPLLDKPILERTAYLHARFANAGLLV